MLPGGYLMSDTRELAEEHLYDVLQRLPRILESAALAYGVAIRGDKEDAKSHLPGMYNQLRKLRGVVIDFDMAYERLLDFSKEKEE